MKNTLRLIAVCLVLIMAVIALGGCFGGSKNEPVKQVVDKVYKYENTELVSVERPDYESETFTGEKYIHQTSLDKDGYMYSIMEYDADYNVKSFVAYLGDYEGGAVTEIPLNVVESEDGYRGVQNIIRIPDGLITIVYENKVIDEENFIYENNYFAEIYGLDGTIRKTVDFKQAFNIADDTDSYFGINQLCYAAGDLFVTVYADSEEYNNKVVRLGMDGAIKEVISFLPEGAEGYVSRMNALGEDKLCVPTEIYGENYEQKLIIVDLNTGERTEVDAGNDYEIMYRSFVGADGGMYYANDSGVNAFDIATGEKTQLMDFINSDYIYNYGSYYAISKDEFVSLTEEYEEDSNSTVLSLTRFTKVPDEELVPKYLITVASAGGAYNFRDQIIEFNLASEEYRIKYIDYSEYNTAEDYTAGQTKLQNDIIAGNVPDVLITDQQFTASKYANKGLFVDLYTYMDSDPELPRSVFLDNILSACETNGKLYEIPTNIYVMGLMGLKDAISEYGGLTMREFYNKVSALPEGVSFFREGDYSRNDLLETMFFINYVNFINPSTGLCSLNNDDFKALLEWVGTQPELSRYAQEDFDYDTFDYEAYENMFKEGKAIGELTSLSSFEDFSNYSYTFGNNEFGFIGVPAPDRDGLVFTATNLKFLISAKGNFPEQAWNFVKVFFTEENQRDLGWGFPVIKSALEAEKQETLDRIAEREAQKAEEEAQQDSVTYESVGVIGGNVIAVKPSYMPDYRETTREDVETIYNIVLNVKKQLRYDESILDIITEEASEYFAGKKSIDDVAAQAESRVNIKLGEAM